MRAIVDALDASEATGHEAVAKDLSRAALMGARGNSGVILSQIVRGLARVLGEQDEIDSKLLARALRAASDEAYRAIQKPVEGTMLTVIREMAEEAEHPDVIVLPKDELLRRVVERGEDAVRRTPEMLEKLRDAGVVDAGGFGLVELVRGIYFSVAGIALPDPGEALDDHAQPEQEHEFSEFQFCTNFVVEGQDLDRDSLSEELWLIGDSLHVVGDPSMLRVHVHTDEPTRASRPARGIGTVIESTVDVADMDEQIRERLPDLRTAVIAVASGEGNRRLFGRTFGEVVVVAGGQSANPSAKEIAEAVDAAHAPEAIVLPNNRNVVGAAIQAGEFTSKPTRVVETHSVQAGPARGLGRLQAQRVRRRERGGDERRDRRDPHRRGDDGVANSGRRRHRRDGRRVARSRGRPRGRVRSCVRRGRARGRRRSPRERLGHAHGDPRSRRPAARRPVGAPGRSAPTGARRTGGRRPAALPPARVRVSAAPLRVLLVEDNEVYRSTLALLLDGSNGIEVVGEVANGREVVEAVERLRPDVVVVDYRLPGASGDQVTTDVLAASPGTTIVCLTAEATADERLRVLAAGAVALVEKGGPTREIVDAIRSGRAP